MTASERHYHVYVYQGEELDPSENHVLRSAAAAEHKAERLNTVYRQARVVRCTQRLADCAGLPSQVPAPINPSRKPQPGFEEWKADNGW